MTKIKRKCCCSSSAVLLTTMLLAALPKSSRSISRRSTCAFGIPSTLGRNTRKFAFDLFAINNEKNKEKVPERDDFDVINEEDEEDIPTWLRGLGRWPLYPPNPEKNITSDTEKDDWVGLIRTVPLVNLINIEALLMINGEETLEDTKDLEMYAAGLNATHQGESALLTPLSILPDLEELGNWDKMVNRVRQSVVEAGSGTSAAIEGTKETLLRETTRRIDYLLTEASTTISPAAVQDLIQRAGRALSSQDGTDPVTRVEQVAREQGLNVSEAVERAKKTTEYTTSLVQLANRVLLNGYAHGDKVPSRKTVEADQKPEESEPLFAQFKTAKIVQPVEYKSAIGKVSEMGALSGAIYQETVPRTRGLGHSIVANGTTDDVTWMITDCVATTDEYRVTPEEDEGKTPVFVRTITIKGFDASDEDIDRECLLNTICTATPETLKNGVLVHSGLMSLAKAIYKDVKGYIDLMAPKHRLVINGHSVGGSLSLLLLLLMVEDRGVEYVREKVLRVFTFGSPPVVTSSHDFYDGEVEEYLRSIEGIQEIDPEMEPYHCNILSEFGLPSSLVYGFVQPWDPIVRLFTDIDPLYPLLGDMAEDGVTVYASGPPRTLRPITRAIFESWEGWPRFRDTFRSTSDQNYTSVGVQHILLPEPLRYLTDRIVAANVNVPPIEMMLRISSKELLPGLDKHFPLDTFRISFVPAAIRGFIHHFYPAYGFPIVDFSAKKLKRPTVSKKVNDGEKEDYRRALDQVEESFTSVTSAKQTEVDQPEPKAQQGSGWTAPGWLQIRRESENL